MKVDYIHLYEGTEFINASFNQLGESIYKPVHIVNIYNTYVTYCNISNVLPASAIHSFT